MPALLQDIVHLCYFSVCLCAFRPAYSFLTLDVIEAMCSCLIAEAEDGEQSRRSEVEQERRILTEFGRCLTQVIDSASRTRGVQRQATFVIH